MANTEDSDGRNTIDVYDCVGFRSRPTMLLVRIDEILRVLVLCQWCDGPVEPSRHLNKFYFYYKAANSTHFYAFRDSHQLVHWIADKIQIETDR